MRPNTPADPYPVPSTNLPDRISSRASGINNAGTASAPSIAPSGMRRARSNLEVDVVDMMVLNRPCTAALGGQFTTLAGKVKPADAANDQSETRSQQRAGRYG